MDGLCVSVVIPVYNGGRKMARCLESLDKQDFAGRYEVIIVDDASTDDSVACIKEKISCLRNGERFKILECPINGRAGTARNKGVLSARGEYVLFVDQDDYPDTALLGTLYSLSEGGHIDYVSCGVGDKQGPLLRCPSQDGLVTHAKRREICLGQGYVFASLIRRRMLLENDIFFPEGLMFEDVLYNLFVGAHITSYKSTDDVLYYRTIDEASQTTSLSIEKLSNRVEAAMWYVMRSRNDDAMASLKDEITLQAFYYVFESCILWMMRDSRFYDEGLFERCWNFGRELDPSWNYLLENEKRFTRKELFDLKKIYHDKKYFYRLAPRYRLAANLGKMRIMWPVKKICERLSLR